MAITRPTVEQIRFVSTKTGDHVLDSYMEMVERGTRTLYELLDDVFDPDTGELYPDFVQIRINETTKEFQFRSGQYLDPEANWQSSGTYVLRHRGAWAASTTYKQFDVVTYNNGSYVCQTSHTSSASFDATKFGILVDANYVSTYAANALASQNAAASSEANAAASEAAASASEIAAAASEANVIALYDNFDDRYLGPYASDPTLDNDGNPLIVGALYFNTAGVLRVYDGALWQNAAPPPGLVIAYDQQFSGDGITTSFILSNPPYSDKTCHVFITGVRQVPGGIDYSLVGTTLTFTSAPPTGVNNIYVTWTTPTGSIDQITTAIVADKAVTFPKLQDIADSTVIGNTTGVSGSPHEIPISQLGFDSGTAMVFKQTSAPTGWTKDTTPGLDDSTLRIVTGTASSGGANAFSTVNAQSTVGSTTLATAQIPSHEHTGAAINLVAATVPGAGMYVGNGAPRYTGSTGGGGSHDHTITMNIKYNDVIVATKD